MIFNNFEKKCIKIIFLSSKTNKKKHLRLFTFDTSPWDRRYITYNNVPNTRRNYPN